jgi:hypothetical protein
MSLGQTASIREQRKLVQRIREEFEEIPGLRLTVHEASEFWALEETVCESVLRQLETAGFLAQSTDHRFEMYQWA